MTTVNRLSPQGTPTPALSLEVDGDTPMTAAQQTSLSASASSGPNTSAVVIKYMLFRMPARPETTRKLGERYAMSFGACIPTFLCRLPGGKEIPISQIAATNQHLGGSDKSKNSFDVRLDFAKNAADSDLRIGETKAESASDGETGEGTSSQPAKAKMQKTETPLAPISLAALETRSRKIPSGKGENAMSDESWSKVDEPEAGAFSQPRAKKPRKENSPAPFSLSELVTRRRKISSGKVEKAQSLDEEGEPSQPNNTKKLRTENSPAPISLAGLRMDFSDVPYLTEDIFRIWHDYRHGIAIEKKMSPEELMGLFLLCDSLLEEKELARSALLKRLHWDLQQGERNFLLNYLLNSDFEATGDDDDQRAFERFYIDCAKTSEGRRILEESAATNPKAAYYLGRSLQSGLLEFINLQTPVSLIKQAADQGYSKAFSALAYCYLNGEGLTRTERELKAFPWFLKAAEAGDTRSQIYVAEQYEKEDGFVPHNHTLALEWFQKAAQSDDADAWYQLGHFLRSGDEEDEVDRNPDETIKWLTKAANAGLGEAAFDLGELYFETGRYQSYREAFKWYKEAADLGYPEGQYKLSRCYFRGFGIEKNTQLGVEWLARAAKSEAPEAQLELALCYQKGYHGVQQDHRQAAVWFSKAAHKEIPHAQYELALYLLAGTVIPRDDLRAISLLTSAANGNNSDAQLLLGKYYLSGRGVTQNAITAFNWFTRASVGNINARNYLASCYERGQGVVQNFELALYWYNSAAALGDMRGKYNAARFYLFGIGVQQNYATAFSLLQPAADANIPEAQYLLADCFRFGRGTQQSNDRAIHWYTRAAANGHQGAQNALAQMQQPQVAQTAPAV